MPKIDELFPIARWNAYILFVIDASDHMAKGNKADILNLNMQEMVEALQEAARHNSDINLKIAVLTYNTDCRWLTENSPENAVNFVWRNPKIGGSANLGSALRELNHKLSLHSWVKSRMRYDMPTIIFVSGGSATDDWKFCKRMICSGFLPKLDFPLVTLSVTRLFLALQAPVKLSSTSTIWNCSEIKSAGK